MDSIRAIHLVDATARIDPVGTLDLPKIAMQLSLTSRMERFKRVFALDLNLYTYPECGGK